MIKSRLQIADEIDAAAEAGRAAANTLRAAQHGEPERLRRAAHALRHLCDQLGTLTLELDALTDDLDAEATVARAGGRS